MRTETNALLGRVVFEQKRPWQDLFRSTETFVSDTLARHYGLPLPGSTTPTWVPYGNTGRKGILSHGGFLSLGAKFGDTSPTIRGKLIRELLFCQEVPEKPPEVDSDNPPTSASPCKWDRYAAHRQGGCAGCHALMDPVGFGLENYDAQGRYRTQQYWAKNAEGDWQLTSSTTAGAVKCDIKSEGALDGAAFKGPAQLADLMLGSGNALNRCAVTQLHRYAIGRIKLDATDEQLVALLTRRLGDKDFRFDELLLDFVSSSAFAHRRQEN